MAITEQGETERIRALKQEVVSDVACVLARANGADISPRQAQSAARNLCNILFDRSYRPGVEIPKLFWETPLGRAVGACLGIAEREADGGGTSITLHLPSQTVQQLQKEADASGRTLTEVAQERLANTERCITAR